MVSTDRSSSFDLFLHDAYHVKKVQFEKLNVILEFRQPNFDELIAEPYMIKCVKRTMIAIYFFVALNLVFYALILFHPSESLQNLAQALISPLPINNTAVKVVGFVVCGVYCTGAWLMPFAIFTAVCLTLIHQCSRLRKTMRLTASADGLARVKILRRQHSSLCGSVRKVDNLFKFLTLVVYVTNIPLVCFLLYHLIFVKYNDAVTLIHSFTEVVQRVQISNVDLDTHTELMLFVAKLNGDPVGITAGGLVPITKPLIVTVIIV
ncbi:hypothetical protein OS493_006569 [Desmophyllum pertusum]|uniref:Uncharacterized protein n=1 Tax=Desmophyllum pertusum TaxID=174260 RepID=A0A9X0DD24_9CNID|nr:hypothetical protein OS493_006569 [Desmophyllum pertusum]